MPPDEEKVVKLKPQTTLLEEKKKIEKPQEAVF
jgi:hypothetical protein